MKEQPTPFDDDTLHAYVDGTLDGAQRDAVERALERDPALAARARDYFALNGLLRERYDRILAEPVPRRLSERASARRGRAANGGWPFGAMAASLLVGVALGLGAGFVRDLPLPGMTGGASPTRPVSASPGEGFARQAALAHVVYMPEVERPPQIGAAQQQDFAQWLANRLGTDMHAPMLDKSGFELTGGRILPGTDGPVAQFMYRSAHGERVTVCISHRAQSADTTAFRLYEDGPVKVFYWVDGDYGYAVSGGIARKVLLQLAHDVYAQLTAGAGG
jgi:anti-sigma factor RsiW